MELHRNPHGPGDQPFDIVLMRIGFSTISAMTAATMLSAAATRNTAFQAAVRCNQTSTCCTSPSGAAGVTASIKLTPSSGARELFHAPRHGPALQHLEREEQPVSVKHDAPLGETAGSPMGRKRLQFRGRCALAREVPQRHQRLGAHARVIVVEQLAQLRHRGLDSGVSRPEAPQVPRRQTADEVDPIARPLDQSGDGVGALRFYSRQRSGRPHADEAHRVRATLR